MSYIIVVLIIALIYFFVKYILKTFFATKRRDRILDEIKIIFNGRLNFRGNPEFEYQNRNITIEYDFETGTRGAYEYIIALIDISDIDDVIIKKLDKKFDFIEKHNKVYIEIYSSWGYQGSKFKERLDEKISLLNSELAIYKSEESVK